MHLTLLVSVTVLAILHLATVFQAFINFDEFRYLADVYSYKRGTLESPLQSFHVHLFSWLTGFGASEPKQIIAARFIYYILLLGSCACVYLIAQRFFSVTAALFAVLCYLAYAEVVIHGTSFRFDGLSVFLLLAALAVLLRIERASLALPLAGALAAVALLVTIKSVLYLPTIGFVVLLRNSRTGWRYRAGEMMLFMVCLAGFVSVLFMAHTSSIGTNSSVDTIGTLHEVGNKQVRGDIWFPGRRYALATVASNLMIWFFLVLGTGAVCGRLLRSERVTESLLLLALLLPLGSLVFYRNAFSYFYVFLMPAPLVVCGVYFDSVRGKLLASRAPLAVAFISLLIGGALVNFAGTYARVLRPAVPAQQQVIDAVHRIFPTPVPYIDAYSMIPSFPKVGFFMSTWGVERYLERGVPIFRQLLLADAPRFLISNDRALVLDTSTTGAANLASSYALLDEDAQVLSDNFVPHWGPIHVAGKRLSVARGRVEDFEILMPGTYEVEATGSVLIDDVVYQPGDAVVLPQGNHRIQVGGSGQVVTLRWGVDLYRPRQDPLPLPGTWAATVSR